MVSSGGDPVEQGFNTSTCSAGTDLCAPALAGFASERGDFFRRLLCILQTSLSWSSSIFFFPSVKPMEGVHRGLSETVISLQQLPVWGSPSESTFPAGVPDRKQLSISTQKIALKFLDKSCSHAFQLTLSLH